VPDLRKVFDGSEQIVSISAVPCTCAKFSCHKGARYLSPLERLLLLPLMPPLMPPQVTPDPAFSTDSPVNFVTLGTEGGQRWTLMTIPSLSLWLS
jgi:hypothetical protein